MYSLYVFDNNCDKGQPIYDFFSRAVIEKLRRYVTNWFQIFQFAKHGKKSATQTQNIGQSRKYLTDSDDLLVGNW